MNKTAVIVSIAALLLSIYDFIMIVGLSNYVEDKERNDENGSK